MTYLASLRATRAMDLRVVLLRPRRAGHRPPRADRRAPALHERRARKIAGLIAAAAATGLRASRSSMWGNVAVTQAYLTLSEVLGHIDLLLERGEVVEVEDDGVVRFATA